MDNREQLRRIFLAGVGMMSEACDVTKHTLEELTERGTEFLDEQSVKTRKWFDEMVRKGEDLMRENAAGRGEEKEPDPASDEESEFLERWNRLSPEARERLRKKMDR